MLGHKHPEENEAELPRPTNYTCIPSPNLSQIEAVQSSCSWLGWCCGGITKGLRTTITSRTPRYEVGKGIESSSDPRQRAEEAMCSGGLWTEPDLVLQDDVPNQDVSRAQIDPKPSSRKERPVHISVSGWQIRTMR